MIFAIGKNIYKRALSINNTITSDIQFLIQVINLLVY